MQTYKIEAPLTFGPGAVLELDARQLSDRRHAVTVTEGGEDGGTVVTSAHVSFKAGEIIGIDGDPPKGVAAVTIKGGLRKGRSRGTPAQQVTAAKGAESKASAAALERARAEGHKAGREEMLAEIVKRNGLIEAEEAAADALAAAEDALAAGAEADKPALQAAVDAAKTALATAQAAVAALPAIEA